MVSNPKVMGVRDQEALFQPPQWLKDSLIHFLQPRLRISCVDFLQIWLSQSSYPISKNDYY
jgi:hypothetical protein